MYILHKRLEWRWREERLLLGPKLVYGPLSVLNFECGSRMNRSFWCSSREEHLESSRDSEPLWLLHILGCCFPVSSTLTHGYSKCIFRVWAAFLLAFFSSDIYMASLTWRTKKCDIGGKTYYFPLCRSTWQRATLKEELILSLYRFGGLEWIQCFLQGIFVSLYGFWNASSFTLQPVWLESLHHPRFQRFLLYFPPTSSLWEMEAGKADHQGAGEADWPPVNWIEMITGTLMKCKINYLRLR